MTRIIKKFPLLNEIDGQINSDNIDWNQNAFETLLTSNLPTTTIIYYAVDVGLRRLENSLYEAYWAVTADALNDLSQFLFNTESTDETESYLYEAKCQLLLYASIAIIKFNTIRRRSINDSKMSCATMCLLLLEQSKSYETSTMINDYSSCIHSMRYRYLKRMFIIGQWLPTLSKLQFNDIHSKYEEYTETMIDNLFPLVSLRDKINGFIDHCLLNNNNDENEDISSGFVFIRRFPKFNEKTIEKHNNLMHLGLVNTLKQLNKNNPRKLICCIWTLCCMIEADRISLAVLSHCIKREHFSFTPIDFEQKPITIESLNEQDIIVFLLLCAQQNTHWYESDSAIHPYLIYSSTLLCTQNQINWWQIAIEQISSSKFVNYLAIVRLDEEQFTQYPPQIIILQTAKILFKTAEIAYEQGSNHVASSYEQYAIQYLQTAKAQIKNPELNNAQGNKSDKLFFSYPQKSVNDANKKSLDQLIDECEKLARQCDELKLLPEPELPRASSLTNEVIELFSLDPVHVDVEEEIPSLSNDSTLFVTAPLNASDDNNVETTVPPAEETVVTQASSLTPFVDILFSHMSGVNQWINRFYTNNEGIQNDIHTIRDRLEKLNRSTSQMIFTNVRVFQSNPNENSEHFYPHIDE